MICGRLCYYCLLYCSSSTKCDLGMHQLAAWLLLLLFLCIGGLIPPSSGISDGVVATARGRLRYAGLLLGLLLVQYEYGISSLLLYGTLMILDHIVAQDVRHLESLDIP